MRLPDFLIIGTMKGGTTAATYNLSLHPDVWMVDGATKQQRGDDIVDREMHFFNRDERWERGTEWYGRFFEPGRQHTRVGESTPNYLDVHRAHPRMHKILPQARLVVFLRDPVERAFSHWYQMVQDKSPWDWHGYSAMRFIDAVEHALALTKASPPQIPGILRFGLYAVHLEHLLRWFRREQVLVCISELVMRDMEREYARVFEFIGASPHISLEYRMRHVRRSDALAAAPMEPSTREQLARFFASHNKHLFELLGEKIPQWTHG